MRVGVVVLAAGRGVRMGGEVPKAFLPLKGRPLFLFALEAFEGMGNLVLVVPPGWEERARGFLKEEIPILPGGDTRQESSLRGLEALEDVDYVLIHDAARPLVTQELVERVLAVAPRAAVPVLRTVEAVVEVEGDRVVRGLDRSRVHHVQTPQGFPYAGILNAHQRAIEEGFAGVPDDATLYLMAGGEVVAVEGERQNIKVTFPEDLRVAEALLG